MSHGITRSEYNQRFRDESLRERELKKLGEYNALVASTQELRSSGDLSLNALHHTSDVLKINPEFYTMWNYRRDILLNTQFVKFKAPPSAPEAEGEASSAEEGDQQAPNEVIEALIAAHDSRISLYIKEELAFLVPLLTAYPKCYWLWNHRLWVLQQSSLLANKEKAAVLWRAELELVGMMLRRDTRNFHGWMYRRIVISNIEQQEQGKSLVKDEFVYTTKMLQGVGGMANYSAWHRRATLIPRLLEERSATVQERMDFLEDELDVLKRTMTTDPEDQSLWFYHRWLVHSNAAPGRDGSGAIAPEMPRSVRTMMVDEEVEWLKELLEGHQDCKYILKALVTYTSLLQQIRKEPPEEGEDEEDVEPEAEDIDEIAEVKDMKKWLERLISIDPMRKGRYEDLGRSFTS